MSRRGFLLFLAIGLAWGVPYFFLAVAGKDFSTPTVIFSRVTIGALVMVPLAIQASLIWLTIPKFSRALAEVGSLSQA